MVPDHSTHHNAADVALAAINAPRSCGVARGATILSRPFAFGLTIFLSATLLFMVQPLFARMVLPRLGGSPAVWNTALVFFQAALLLGYLYAHALTSWCRPRQQVLVHLVVLAVPLLLLPLAVPTGWTPPSDRSPVMSLLVMLTLTVGLPFFVVSSTSPLLQKWFALTGHSHAHDPYFLYAASNFGSLLGLLSYPLVLEPGLPLQQQSWLWTSGYVLFVGSVLWCGLAIWRQAHLAAPPAALAPTEPPPQSESNADRLATDSLAINWKRRARWVLLAFVPSSLMVSVTTHLGTHVAAVPLMWVIPLAVFLVTFILVFARRPLISHNLMVRAFPLVILPLVVILTSRASERVWWVGAWHLLNLFVVAMVCHGALVKNRPIAKHLTEFYLWMSVGGVLGGAFNALLAPIIFTSVAEYPITLALACLLLPAARRSEAVVTPPSPRGVAVERLAGTLALQDVPPSRQFLTRARLLDVAIPLAIGLLAFNLVSFMYAIGIESVRVILGLNLCLPPLLCFVLAGRPLRFGLAVGMILLAATWLPGEQDRTVAAERSFFGVHRVIDDATGGFRRLQHGGTIHGMQNLDPQHRFEPLAYYYPSGPIGQVFRSARGAATQQIAVVGLGAGGMAAYALPGQAWTFYEIDATVERIARDPRCFTYLSDCRVPVNVVLGDARLSLASTATRYDVLVLDAYSSDSVPVHLLTREALQLYLARLTPGGVLVFHITNRHLDLESVVAGLVSDAGLAAAVWDDAQLTPAQHARGKRASKWAVAARSPDDIDTLLENPNWKPLRQRPALRLWTDDYSSVFSVFRWE